MKIIRIVRYTMKESFDLVGGESFVITYLLWCLKMPYNVRRYVALAQSRGGARFCTRGAMQDYDVVCLLSRWQKP